MPVYPMNDSYPLALDLDVRVDDVMESNMTSQNTSSTSTEETIEYVINSIGIALGVASIVLNLIFIFGMRYLRDKPTAYHRFLKNLSFADAMASFSFLWITNCPKGFFSHIQGSQGFILVRVLPYVFRSLPWMFFTGYLLTLSCLTLNQYVAVCKPWRYSELVTNQRVTISLVIVWSLSLLQILIPVTILLILYSLTDKKAAMAALYFVSRIEIQIWMAIFALSVIANIVLDVIIYNKIRQLKLKRRYSSMSNNPESCNIRMKQEAFVTVALLLIASVFCRLPFPLVGIIGINVQTRILNAGIVMLLYLNFFVDPIIYVLRMKEVRKTYRRLIGKCAHCFPCCAGEHFFTRSISSRMISLKMETTQHTVINIEMQRRDSGVGSGSSPGPVAV